jgi:hypothetical protein
MKEGPYAARIAKVVEKLGEVPPLWAAYPRVHPMDIHWRMGAGEDYRYLFSEWVASRPWSPEERVAFVRRWHPPFSWLDWVASFLWPEDFSGDVYEASADHFARMEALGLGSRADWSRCFEVDPEAYPLPDDVSKGWLDEAVRNSLIEP